MRPLPGNELPVPTQDGVRGDERSNLADHPPSNGFAAHGRSDRTLRRGGKSSRGRNYTWAELLRRVFAVDILACPDCGGRMRILSAIHSPEAIRGILDCLGLPSRAPPISPALCNAFAITSDIVCAVAETATQKRLRFRLWRG